jgi:hypothetical protein
MSLALGSARVHPIRIKETMMTRHPIKAALLGATLLAGAGTAVAMAQDQGGLFDTSQLPVIKGKVAQYDLTPRGDVDGLILDDGTEVHTRPDLGLELVAAVRPGESVTIHGLKARSLKLVQALSVTGDASGQTVSDDGESAGRPPRPGPGPRGRDGNPIEAQGVVKMALHGPRGDTNGVLLQDGTMIHLPPDQAAGLSDMLAPGKTILARGDGLKSGLGTVIGARAIGPDAQHLTTIAGPSPRHGIGGPADAPPPPPPPPNGPA